MCGRALGRALHQPLAALMDTLSEPLPVIGTWYPKGNQLENRFNRVS